MPWVLLSLFGYAQCRRYPRTHRHGRWPPPRKILNCGPGAIIYGGQYHIEIRQIGSEVQGFQSLHGTYDPQAPRSQFSTQSNLEKAAYGSQPKSFRTTHRTKPKR